jgi:hypothetical protein
MAQAAARQKIAIISNQPVMGLRDPSFPKASVRLSIVQVQDKRAEIALRARQCITVSPFAGRLVFSQHCQELTLVFNGQFD